MLDDLVAQAVRSNLDLRLAGARLVEARSRRGVVAGTLYPQVNANGNYTHARISETGIPIPFAPGDLLLIIAGVAIASDTVDAGPMVSALLLATILGAMVGREVFAAVGRPALMKAADALRFRPALERATHVLRRRGAPAVFIGRLVPGLRISTTQVAGVSKMPRLTFAAGLIPSVVIYIAIFVGLGALAGQGSACRADTGRQTVRRGHGGDV